MSNLHEYLSPHDNRFNAVKTLVSNLASDIPEFTLSLIHERSSSVSSHLIAEMETIFNDSNRFSVVSTGDPWEKKFDNFYLKKLSTYRMVQQWMAHPIGLATEVWVEQQKFHCPECNEHTLVLSGGSNAAWADLHCSNCKDVFIELKSKKSKALNRIKRNKTMTAGSYRWYKAQERTGVKHYMVIVPKDGGNIFQFKITRANHTVDNKFCAFYNTSPEHVTLRTELHLGHSKKIGYAPRSQMADLEVLGCSVVKKWTDVTFGRYARKIQRAYKKFQFKN